MGRLLGVLSTLMAAAAIATFMTRLPIDIPETVGATVQEAATPPAAPAIQVAVPLPKSRPK